jgi:hypothetical protein
MGWSLGWRLMMYRWKAPQPAPLFRKPFNASTYGQTCAQASSNAAWSPQGEDCLNLNIWAPSSGKNLPVSTLTTTRTYQLTLNLGIHLHLRRRHGNRLQQQHPAARKQLCQKRSHLRLVQPPRKYFRESEFRRTWPVAEFRDSGCRDGC